MNNNQNSKSGQHTFGFEWAYELESDILKNLGNQSCVELIPENFTKGRFHSFLRALEAKATPVAVHGVLLSIGSMEPLNQSHLDSVLEVGKRVNMVNFSEHLSFTNVKDIALDALTPLAWNQDVADVICKKIDRIQSQLKVPFLIENVSNRFMVPDTDFTETEFINYILGKTGCGLLLDVTNVYTNSINFNFDPYAWIDEIDLTKVGLVHLAGGFMDPDGFLMDSHDNSVAPGAWDLYRYAVNKAPPFMTIIERTGNFPNFQMLEQELAFARNAVLESYPSYSQMEVLA